ncbi:phospholipase D family protein [Butyrivibrio sp.]|uniref:phospholipase D family protein n=1 Tax=Butyrivibrio sp. TaxID=28121 RepID=UPI0025C05C9C|nr:phospholipase D family protein [Butyrivibrio sp.]MBQ9303487.1 phospholipase D family protein [Butyrivibrio sp.]
MNNGLKATIIAYRNYKDVGVRFANGVEVLHRRYDSFKKGAIACPGVGSYQPKTSQKESRLGEEKTMSNGMIAKIVGYSNCKNIDVEFEDGTVRKGCQYNDFQKGWLNPTPRSVNGAFAHIDRIGESFKMSNGMMASIIVYRTSTDIDVRFEDGTIVEHVRYDDVKKGVCKYSKGTSNDIAACCFGTAEDTFSDATIYHLENRRIIKLDPAVINGAEWDEVHIATYVTSPSVLYEIARKSKNCECILGIDDSEYIDMVNKSIIKNISVEGANFFAITPDDIKNLIVTDNFALHALKNGVVCHSKMYLLRKGDYRITLVGSFNLTEKGLGIRGGQYEDGFLSTSPDVYDMYMQRFLSIKKDTIDYIPDKCKKLWENEQRTPLPSEMSDIKLDYIGDNAESLSVTTTQLKNMKADADPDSQTAAKIINEITDKAKSSVRHIKSLPELQVIKPKLNLRVDKYVDTSHLGDRMQLHYSKETNALYSSDAANDATAERFNAPLSNEELKVELQKLMSLTSWYRHMAANPSQELESTVWEILLHAFQAPFMSQVRKAYKNIYQNSSDSSLGKIPNFLLINGPGNTGKSILINIINCLLQNGMYDIPEWHDYRQDPYLLEHQMTENNLYPVIVDEVKKEFLRKGKIRGCGEEWIKAYSNSLGVEARPYMLAATNEHIELPTYIQSRLTYISMNDVFKCHGNLEPDDAEWLDSFKAGLDNRLFKAFCDEMLKRIASGEVYRKQYNTEFYSDYVGAARDIFIRWFEETGLGAPEVFPLQPRDDYAYRGRRAWRNTFRDTTVRSAFLPVSDTELQINKEKLTDKQYNTKSITLFNLLNNRLIIEHDEGGYCVVDRKKFFDWIGLEDPWIQKTEVNEDLSSKADESEPVKTPKQPNFFKRLFRIA